MKKNFVLTTTILIGLSLLVSCKKKESTPPPTPTPAPPVRLNTMTAKVNNVDWAMETNELYSASFITKFANKYAFEGDSSLSNPKTSIRLNFIYATGVHNLGGSSSNFYARYTDTSNTYYTSRTGTINITTIDTTGASIFNKFKATFSFSTDTINNKSYIITNGVVDYEHSN